MPKPDIEKLEAARGNLMKMADAIQSVIDGERSQAAAAGSMGLSPNDFSRWLRSAFAPYIKKKLVSLDFLPDMLAEAMGPSEKLVMDVLGLELSPGFLPVLPDFDEDGLWDAVETLYPREREAVRLSYGRTGGTPDGPMDPIDLSRRLGTTPWRARQIKAKAIRKLRHPSRLRLFFPDRWAAVRAVDAGACDIRWPPVCEPPEPVEVPAEEYFQDGDGDD